MAGVKGRSGSGGPRPGSGPKPKPPTLLQAAKESSDPVDFLRSVMNDQMADAKLRVDAAKALMPYVHGKKAEGGKKEQRQAAAEEVVKDATFATGTGPKLVVNNSK